MPFGNFALNPNGIPSFSPGLPSPRGYPGLRDHEPSTLKGLHLLRRRDATPLGLKIIVANNPG